MCLRWPFVFKGNVLWCRHRFSRSLATSLNTKYNLIAFSFLSFFVSASQLFFSFVFVLTLKGCITLSGNILRASIYPDPQLSTYRQ